MPKSPPMVPGSAEIGDTLEELNTVSPKVALVELGFTEVEADVYLFLLTEPGASGYRIAQGTGRLSANVYQALESLALKGAVVMATGERRRASAVPATELMQILRSRFEATQDQAAAALKGLAGPPPDREVYRITSPEQVYAKCRSMLARAERLLLLDLFPPAVSALEAEISAATVRGIETRVKLYAPSRIEASEVCFNTRPDFVLKRYRGTAITVSMDAREILVAWVSADGSQVLDAVWTASPTLAFQCYVALAGNLELYSVASVLASLESWEELQELLDPVRSDIIPRRPTDLGSYFTRHRGTYEDVPGFGDLLKSLGLEEGENTE